MRVVPWRLFFPFFRSQAPAAAPQPRRTLARASSWSRRARSTPASWPRRWSSRASRTRGSAESSSPTGLISRDDLGTALARQSGLGRIDLAASPADPELVARHRPLPLPGARGGAVAADRRHAGSWRSPTPTTPRRRWRPAAGRRRGWRWRWRRPRTSAARSPRPSPAACATTPRERCPEAFSCRGWTLAREPAAGRPLAVAVALAGGAGGAGAGAAARHGVDPARQCR